MLEGYEKLYRKVGGFCIEEDQVMIDESGKVRVWVNSDFSDNQAEDAWVPNTPRSSKNEEYNMVSDMMDIIFQAADES
jgi:uncharacterized protein YrzB (UPF0473 family)